MLAEKLNERRRLKRFIIELPVFNADRGDYLGHTENMHVEGMLLISKKHLPLHTEHTFRLEYMLKNHDLVCLDIPTRVQWYERDEESGKFTTGVKFMNLEPKQVNLLNSLIDDLEISI